jgi:hypothetical protein
MLKEKMLKIARYLVYYPPRLFLPTVYMNPMTRYIKENYKATDLIGVEIGVANGINAFTMLKNLPIKKLYLVDPYEPWLDTDSGEMQFVAEHEKICYRRLSPFKDKTVFIKKYSDAAVNDIQEYVDFVYIDGDHDYDFVKKDINSYYPKVKQGGILGGHDFWGSYKGVVLAVLDFVKENNLELHTNECDWWVVVKK